MCLVQYQRVQSLRYPTWVYPEQGVRGVPRPGVNRPWVSRLGLPSLEVPSQGTHPRGTYLASRVIQTYLVNYKIEKMQNFWPDSE